MGIIVKFYVLIGLCVSLLVKVETKKGDLRSLSFYDVFLILLFWPFLMGYSAIILWVTRGKRSKD